MSHVFNKTANITGDWRFSSCQSKLKKSLSMTGNPIKKDSALSVVFLMSSSQESCKHLYSAPSNQSDSERAHFDFTELF